MNTKSRAVLLRELLFGVLTDVERAYPKDAHEWERDKTRLHSIANRSELWFFTLTLPSWSKLLTNGLEQGSISSFGGPHGRPVKGKAYPRLFSGLFSRIFDDKGVLRVDADGLAIRYLQTLLNLGKKLRMQCNDKTVISTVQSFVETEESLRHYTLNWGDDVLYHDHGLSLTGDGGVAREPEERGLFSQYNRPSETLLPCLGAIQSVADRITSSFGSPFGGLEPHHGPGAISDRVCTSSSKYQFPYWPEKLERVFPYAEFGLPNLSYWIQPVDGPELRFKDQRVPSRLIAVPKTQKGPRLIASEPSSNMWMQQALRQFLEKSTQASPLVNCIAFRDQSHSGQLALQSSLTQSHATIDLSDASDRLSCWLIERMFRSNQDLLTAFNAVRTDVIEIRRSRDLPVPKNCPKLIKLKKFSTQGSALTFPVQTIVYAIICVGVLIQERGWRVGRRAIERATGEVRIYGDDIIVPVDVSDKVVEVITHLGFKVNVTKTFSKGNFRESCGVDGYKGMDVTPAYLLEPYDVSRPTSVMSIVECSNNFLRKGFLHASESILKTLPEQVRKHIPLVGAGSGAFGILDHASRPINRMKTRFNKRLHRVEVFAWAIQTSQSKVQYRGDFGLHQYFTEKPSPDTIWEHGEVRRPASKIRRRWVPVETLGTGLALT